MALGKKNRDLTSVIGEVEDQIDSLVEAKAALNVASNALARARRTSLTFGKGTNDE